MTSQGLVLITGGSGFIGSHCIIQCLAAGYQVRTTVRSLNREQEVREMLHVGGATNLENLTFLEADLNKDDGWKEAVQNCAYVLHVASPLPAFTPKDEKDLIDPAREGTLRVLRAARDAYVKRIVITSSIAAVSGGHIQSNLNKPLTEADWTDVDTPGLPAYDKSKTLAERAAWNFIEKEGGDLEMAVINPCMVVGPVLAADTSTSIEVISRFMNGTLPGCPNFQHGFVDVRDVACLHILAMASPKANKERFLCMSPPQLSMKEISLALRERLGDKAKRCPTWSIPDFVMKLVANFDASAALVAPWLGQNVVVSVDKAKNLLGWAPRSNVDAVVATGESLWNLGLVQK